ncbi:hypothetical protein HML84_02130 [Alcanivorax sp. IO_7]|nr:hypothetical protein HML84_02130 [Alcanivorax sp. IO_7]
MLLDQALAFMIEHGPAMAGAAYRVDDDGLHREAARGLNAEARREGRVERDGLLAGALTRKARSPCATTCRRATWTWKPARA